MTGFLPGIEGREELEAELQRLHEAGRFPNGLLLVGEPGRGKRAVALALAEVMVPEGGDDREAAAARVRAGTHPDLYVVEPEPGQRLIGIDRVRGLKESFGLTPAEGSCRVGIVDGAERLTQEAGNALLKVLEEPPPGSHLVLTARSREAVMETLASRCLTLRVPALPADVVRRILEARGADGERAERLAGLSAGRPGLALELFQEDLDRSLLEPALNLLWGAGPPVDRCRRLEHLVREEARGSEGVRHRLRLVLDAALCVLRQGLRASWGARTAGRLPWPASEGSPEARIQGCLRALRAVDRNVSPDVVLAELTLEWHQGTDTIEVR